jgi:hypothetical protein
MNTHSHGPLKVSHDKPLGFLHAPQLPIEQLTFVSHYCIWLSQESYGNSW